MGKDNDEIITFTAVENAVNQSKNLSPHDKILYWTLKTFRNRKSKQCFPSLRKVSNQAGISINTAYKCRANLQAFGIIEYTSESGRKHSCHYRFILEDGNSQEISRALENLSGNKIPQMRDSLNTPNERQLNTPNERHKIPQMRDTNHMKITTRTKPQEGVGVVVDSFEGKEGKDPLKVKEIKKEDRDYIERVIAEGTKDGSILKPSAYRHALEEKAREGKLDTADNEQDLSQNRDAYYQVYEKREAELDKTSATYKMAKLVEDLNVERNPKYRRSEFLSNQVGHFEKLLKTNSPEKVERVLRHFHENGSSSFIWDSFTFTENYRMLEIGAESEWQG